MVEGREGGREAGEMGGGGEGGGGREGGRGGREEISHHSHSLCVLNEQSIVYRRSLHILSHPPLSYTCETHT